MTGMTKKHFAAIARVINETRGGNPDSNAAQAALDLVSLRLAGELRMFNPAFDKARFLTACGMEYSE